MITDYLGTPINIGDRGIRVHSSGNLKSFKKITVKCIDYTRKYGDIVGILSDRKDKIGYTYPERIIVQGSLQIII